MTLWQPGTNIWVPPARDLFPGREGAIGYCAAPVARRRSIGGGGAAALGYDATVLAESSLVHYWKMQEAAGATSIADSKGSLTGTVNGGITFGAGGMFGNGVAPTFNGSTGYISFSSVWGTDAQWTYEAWVDITAFHASLVSGILQNGAFDGSTGGFSRVLISGTSSPGALNYAGNAISGVNGGSMSGSTDYHVAYTFNGTNVTGYLNAAVTAGPSARTPNTPGKSVAFIGVLSAFNDVVANTGTCLTGKICRVAYYNAALSGAQISAHYAARAS